MQSGVFQWAQIDTGGNPWVLKDDVFRLFMAICFIMTNIANGAQGMLVDLFRAVAISDYVSGMTLHVPRNGLDVPRNARNAETVPGNIHRPVRA
jgi:hypothetical protein